MILYWESERNSGLEKNIGNCIKYEFYTVEGGVQAVWQLYMLYTNIYEIFGGIDSNLRAVQILPS